MKDFGPLNFKNYKNIFAILWYMHTNQQTIKKNYLNQIKEIFLASRVDNSRSLFFFFDVFHDLPSRFCKAPKYTLVVFDMFRVFCRHKLNFL